MLRVALTVLAVLSFASLDTADAASKRKKQKVKRAPVVTMPAKPIARAPGPPWAAPGECYMDEGYGRYSSCNTRYD